MTPRSPSGGAAITAVCLMALAVAAALSLLVGRAAVAPQILVQGLLAPGETLAKLIVLELRLPRTVLAVLAGGSLGLSGAVLQGLTRNPLAEPGLLGVSAGAALGAVLAIYFGLANAVALATPLLGLIGALAAGALTFAVGRGGTLSLILAGAAVSGLCGALLALALNFAPNPYAVYEMNLWLLGSLADRGWDQAALVAPFIVAGLALLATLGRAVDALALGEAQAESLGIDLDRTRLLALLGVGLSVGAATSVIGAVGFVGLAAPHLVRPFVGHQPSRTLAPSALVGASLLLLADVAARALATASELRLSVITGLIGAPFFFWLILRLPRTAP